MRPTWLLFDADGVLQGVRDGWLEALTSAGGAGGQEFVLAVFEAERGCMTGEDFDSAMQGVLQQFQIDRPVAEVIDPQYWIEVDRPMLEAVAALRAQGFRCGLATNQQNLRGAYMRGSLGFADLFDGQFYSHELGYAKPDPAYFRSILELIAAPAEGVLFLDDRADNVDGARSVGLHAEVFPHSGGVEALRPLLSAYGIVL